MKKISILFVDDEDHVLKAIIRLLRNEPYILYFANSAKEALEVLERAPIDIIVSDMRMPEMDGLALLREVKKKYPDIIRIILSAYSQAPTLLAAINQGDIYRYITKPWNPPDEFKRVLKEASEYRKEQYRNAKLKEIALELSNRAKEYYDTLISIKETIKSQLGNQEIIEELEKLTTFLSQIETLGHYCGEPKELS